MTFIYYVTIFFFILLCFLLCFVVLIQEGKSGLGVSFGGESSDSLFGASTADVLKRFTAYMAALFLVSCVILSLWTESLVYAKEQRASQAAKEALKQGQSF